MSVKKPPHRTKSETDWRAVEADYRAGRAVRAIAVAHGVATSSVYRRARAGGWMRDAATAAGGRRAAKPNGVPPVAPAATSVASPTPRRELARLRALADKLFGRLERMIDGAGDGDGGVRPGPRESPEALLLKLCQITEKIITMESRLVSAAAPNASRLREQDREIIDRYKQRHRLG